MSAVQKCLSLSESTLAGLSRSTNLFITFHSVLWDIVNRSEIEIMGEALGQYYLNSENIRMISKVREQAKGMQATV